MSPASRFLLPPRRHQRRPHRRPAASILGPEVGHLSFRDEQEFQTRRYGVIAALEEQLAADPCPEDGAELWGRLARVRIQQGREPDALDALERALWYLDAEATARGLLEAGCPWESSDPAALLYGRALDLVVGESSPDSVSLQAEVDLEATRLRTRTLWLLGRLVPGGEAGDLRILVMARLEAGLRDDAIPAFVRERHADEAVLAEWKRRDADAILQRVIAERLRAD